MMTGSTDYGTPAGNPNDKTIFFKDFEYELFVTAQLLSRSANVAFPPSPNDRNYDVEADSIWVQIKHPNVPSRMETFIRDFQGKLRDSGKYGILAVALEDAYNLASATSFNSSTEFDTWYAGKKLEIFRANFHAFRFASGMSHILACITTASFPVIVGTDADFFRRSNIMLFDRDDATVSDNDAVANLAKAFNLSPPTWQSVQEIIRVRAYYHYENHTGSNWQNATSNWIQAEREFMTGIVASS